MAAYLKQTFWLVLLSSSAALAQGLRDPVFLDSVNPRPIVTGLNLGLACYWKLDEASGTRAASAGGQSLTDNNTVTSTAGVIGNAARFTAASMEFLSRADSAPLSITGSKTIVGWFRILVSGLNGVVEKQDEYLIAVASGATRFVVTDSVSGTSQATEGTTIADNTWYFFAAWYDSSDKKAKLQVGVLGGALGTIAEGTALSNGAVNGAGVYTLGNWNSFGFADVDIDELGMWDRVLTTQEIDDLFTGITYPF